MKTFYIRDIEGTIPSCDGKVMYREIRGKEILAYFREEENRSRCFVRGSDCEDAQECWFEVDAALMPMAERAKRRERYLREERERASLQILSLDEVCSGSEDSDPVYLFETCPSNDPDPETVLLKKFDKELLHRQMSNLSELERELIECLYLRDQCKSERELAKQMGISKTALHKRKLQTLKKLNKFLNNG